jgi:hypothetical protein
MPDLTVIEGGGQPCDYEAEAVKRHLRILIIEILRAIARGEDFGHRVAEQFPAIAEHIGQSRTSLAVLIHEVVGEAYRELSPQDDEHEHDREIRRIVLSSLRVAAESLADDLAAKGRRGSRQFSLEKDVESHLVESEKRSRENGWSYLKKLTQRLENAKQRAQYTKNKGALEQALALASAKPGKRGRNKKPPSGKPDSGV